MQTTKAKKAKNRGASQRYRKDSKKRVAIKHISNGRRRLHADKNSGTRITAHPFALAPFEKEIPTVDVLALQGSELEITNEDEQLKCIEDLHGILSNLGGKINLRGKSRAEIIKLLMQKIDQKQRYEEWELIKDENGYTIEGLYNFGGHPCFMTIDFLARINRSYPRLHDFILYALKLVYTYNHITLLHDLCKTKEGYTGMHYEWLTDELDNYANDNENDEERIRDIKNTLEYYGPKGIVSSYEHRLRTINSSLRMYEKELKAFKPENAFEMMAEPFLKSALNLAKFKRSIDEISEDPHGDGCATPRDYMRIIWSWDESDEIYRNICDHIDCAANSIGSIGFSWKEKISKKNNSVTKANCEFASAIENFFDEGHLLSKRMEDHTRGMSENPLPPIQKKKNGKLVNIII